MILKITARCTTKLMTVAVPWAMPWPGARR